MLGRREEVGAAWEGLLVHGHIAAVLAALALACMLSRRDVIIGSRVGEAGCALQASTCCAVACILHVLMPSQSHLRCWQR